MNGEMIWDQMKWDTMKHYDSRQNETRCNETIWEKINWDNKTRLGKKRQDVPRREGKKKEKIKLGRDCLWWVGGIKQAEKRRDKHEMETILEEKIQSEMREKMRDYRRQNEMRINEVRDKVRRDWKRSRKKRQDWMRRDESKWNKTRKDKKMQGVSGVIQTQVLKPHLIWWPWKATYCIYVSVTTIDWVWDSCFAALIKHHPGCTDGQFWVICCVTYRAWMKYGHAASG